MKEKRTTKLDTAIDALRFLANNQRPQGGESTFNAIHLLDIASNLDADRRHVLDLADAIWNQGEEIVALKAKIVQLELERTVMEFNHNEELISQQRMLTGDRR